MKRSLLVFGLALLVAMIGCGNKTDQDELNNASTLTNGLLAMMTNVDAYSGYNGMPKPGVLAPPPGWTGPEEFLDIPEGTQTWYYVGLRVPFTDTLGQPDTLMALMWLTPDIWNDSIADTLFVTKVDFWLWCAVQNTIWWHGTLEMEETDLTHISGAFKWHYQSTWLNYVFTDMGTDTTDESGVIDVTTSDDIKLSAHFVFIEDGSGTGTGYFQSIEFVRIVYFAEPDVNGYKGYFQLASENWKVDHYFPQQGGV